MIVRPLAPGDDAAVRRIFRATLGLGRPVPFPLPGLRRYEHLCLDWYLGPGRADAAVAEHDGAVVGYATVCTDGTAHARATRREALRFTAWAVTCLATGRLPAPARTFWRLRLVDGWLAWRHAAGRRPPAHAHVNLDATARGTNAASLLLAHVDARARAAGLSGWQGEVNAVRGRRRLALERLVGPVVDTVPNRTYSWLAARPVDRLTVDRTIPAATRAA